MAFKTCSRCRPSGTLQGAVHSYRIRRCLWRAITDGSRYICLSRSGCCRLGTLSRLWRRFGAPRSGARGIASREQRPNRTVQSSEPGRFAVGPGASPDREAYFPQRCMEAEQARFEGSIIG